MYGKNDINVIKIHSEKFKTNVISVMFRTRLKKELATKNALLLKYLSLGSKKYPDICEIERKCQDMYGSVFSSDIIKKGAEQILFFYIEVPEIEGKKAKLIKEGVEFLSEIVLNTLKNESIFDEARLLQAKDALKEDIKALKDDKRQYAYQRFKEEMFKGESYGVSGDGYVEDIDEISGQMLMEHYGILLGKAPMEVMFAGNLNGLYLRNYVNKYFDIKRTNTVTLDAYDIHDSRIEPKFIKEDEDVSQGRFCAGYTSALERTDKNVFAGEVLSEILGGAGNSRLYEKVREKEGLSYYVTSSFCPFSMCILVEAGIDRDYEKTAKIIKEEIEEIKKGDISAEEIKKAKKAVLKRIYTLSDSKQSLMDFVLKSIVLDKKADINETIKSVKSLTRGDILKFSKHLEEDTIYFLGRKEDTHDIHS